MSAKGNILSHNKLKSMRSDKDIKYHLDTLCAKDIPSPENTHSHVLPIHATSAFTYASIEDSISVFQGKSDGFVYSRYGNPTVQAVEQKLASLETFGTEYTAGCILTSSGLSAISTMAMSFVSQGDAVLTQADLYGGTTELLNKVVAKSGVQVITVDLNDLDQVEVTLKENPNIKLIYLETPTNPTLKCIDIKAIANLAQKYKVKSAIDNTFSTFYLQQPFTLGIDIVVYSTTKFLNGHGNSIAGAIITKDKTIRKQVWDVMKLMGTNCNAWDAWLLHNGLKTLTLRLDKHCNNAMEIAQYLGAHNKVRKVNYPGLASHSTHSYAVKQMRQYGGMLSFEIDGDFQKAVNFMNNTKLCAITATLGNVDTLLLHPASSSHLNIPKDIREASGIEDGLIRMSVGIENPKDLIKDIEQALA